MHMADALISPAVGGVMWGATGVTIAYAARKVRDELDESKVPLMGVAGAFVFAAQMLNFSIPGTGSSGHLGGALLLAILLGPQAAFLVMASILAVQALFFADGGLLAWGCNVFNLGFFPAFVACPLVYRKIVGDGPHFERRRVLAGSVLAAVVGLQLGAFAVVLQTTASGVSELPFPAFALFMQPIHLAIGVVEGLVTAAVVLFISRAEPELLTPAASGAGLSGRRLRTVIAGFVVAALLAGGALSWFASANADGLEWSIAKVTGAEQELGAGSATHRRAADLQEKTAILPDYTFKGGGSSAVRQAEPDDESAAWPAVDPGTTLSGIVGALTVLAIAAAVGLALRRRAAARARARG